MLKTKAKIVVNKPLKIKKENGKKDIVQTNSLKPKATPKEIIKICFRFFKPINSPARQLTRRPFQNAKNEIKLKIMKPVIKFIA